MSNRPTEKPHYQGHRERLRRRFLAGGGGALADYEVLELVLSLAQPQGDTKPLAKELIREFSGLAGVLAATPTELQRVKGVGEVSVAAIKVVQEAALRMARQEVLQRSVIGSWAKLLEYCQSKLAAQKVEQFHLLFLDAKNALIADEPQQSGTVNHTPIYPREVVKRALELGASSIILVHNHPSGDPTPSQDDIAMTREVAAAAEKLGIALHDHLIIGRTGHASFRGLGLL